MARVIQGTSAPTTGRDRSRKMAVWYRLLVDAFAPDFQWWDGVESFLPFLHLGNIFDLNLPEDFERELDFIQEIPWMASQTAQDLQLEQYLF